MPSPRSFRRRRRAHRCADAQVRASAWPSAGRTSAAMLAYAWATSPPYHPAAMCGLAGILARSDSFAHDDATVAAMAQTIVHRGPDDSGTWTSPEHRVALGFRRLSIIDLSPAGHQPMGNEDGTVW